MSPLIAPLLIHFYLLFSDIHALTKAVLLAFRYKNYVFTEVAIGLNKYNTCWFMILKMETDSSLGINRVDFQKVLSGVMEP